MKKYGLVGKSLGHSFSKRYFTDKFTSGHIDGVYDNYEIKDISLLSDIIRREPTLFGLNVTIPYKEDIIPYLDSLSEAAGKIEAVNCIRIVRIEGEVYLEGHNTDYYGFKESLIPLLSEREIDQAFILGTGGASKGVAYALDLLGIPYHLVSRTAKLEQQIIDYEMCNEQLKDKTLLINSTPLGTYPDIDKCPSIDYDKINATFILHDLVYNPEVTRFLHEGLKRGALCKNGYDMLLGQAEESWSIWNS